MRYSLRDLVVVTLAFVVGLLVVRIINHAFGLPLKLDSSWLAFALGVVAGLAIYLVATPPIYQRFHMRPLWYPLCPKCRDKNRFWKFEAARPNWPRENVMCCSCGTTLELWYGQVSDSVPTPGAPAYALIWPHSFGRWRRIDEK